MPLGATDYRNKLTALMDLTVTDQARVHNWTYLAVRPQLVISTYTSGQKVESDCSDGCRILCRVVGVPDDPAGNNYADYGNSASIWTHLSHGGTAEVGDIYTWGFYGGEHHAAMIRELSPDGNHKLWNMGTEGEPVFSTVANEDAYHHGMTRTLCKLNLPPDPPPTPQEKLRAMTGYWAWVAWKLGEGKGLWKNYKPADPSVRPNVPTKIPQKWWDNFDQYMANRNKGNLNNKV